MWWKNTFLVICGLCLMLGFSNAWRTRYPGNCMRRSPWESLMDIDYPVMHWSNSLAPFSPFMHEHLGFPSFHSKYSPWSLQIIPPRDLLSLATMNSLALHQPFKPGLRRGVNDMPRQTDPNGEHSGTPNSPNQRSAEDTVQKQPHQTGGRDDVTPRNSNQAKEFEGSRQEAPKRDSCGEISASPESFQAGLNTRKSAGSEKKSVESRSKDMRGHKENVQLPEPSETLNNQNGDKEPYSKFINDKADSERVYSDSLFQSEEVNQDKDLVVKGLQRDTSHILAGDEKVILDLPMTGYLPEEVSVRLEGRYLHITGINHSDKPCHSDSKSCSRKQFTKAYKLPSKIDPQTISAKLTSERRLKVFSHVTESEKLIEDIDPNEEDSSTFNVGQGTDPMDQSYTFMESSEDLKNIGDVYEDDDVTIEVIE